MKLLLIDDDKVFQEILHIRFEAVGCQVEVAHSLDQLKSALLRNWDLLVGSAEFQDLGLEKLTEILKPKFNTVLLYTQQKAEEIAPLWKAKGVKEIYPKLRRGDLIRAVHSWVKDQAESRLGPKELPISSKSKKFLLVDDSATIRKFVRVILENGFPGSEIFEAEDGKTAMRELSGQKMDLIVTDMQMPGVDGQSFIKTLHRNPLLNKKPIVILSGMVTKQIKDEFGAVPTVRILCKPADPGLIVETVHSLLEN